MMASKLPDDHSNQRKRSKEPDKQTESSKHSSPAEFSQSEAKDDFKRIKGIGQGVEERLHKAGIHTFAQLANRSPAQVSKILKGMTIMSAEKIKTQDWIGQARQLAEEEQQAEIQKSSLTIQERQRYETFNVKLLVDESNQVRRTNVVHLQKGIEDNWAGWDESRILGFILERADLEVPDVTKAEPVLAVAVVEREETMTQTDADPKAKPSASAAKKASTASQVLLDLPGELAIKSVVVQEVGGAVPSNVIATDQDWSIQVEWTLTGPGPLSGNWQLKALLESIGPGPEYALPNGDGVLVPLSSGTITAPDELRYSHEIKIKSGEVEAGLYLMVISITWEREPGKLGDLAQFFEKSMLQFYARR